MRGFRYRRGVVRESLRVTQRVESIDSDGTARSWCRLTFQPARIEEINDPTAWQVVAAASPCAACALRFEASRDATQEDRKPLPVHDDGSLATILRKAQWLLNDAAFYLPEGRCSTEDCELLADTLAPCFTRARWAFCSDRLVGRMSGIAQPLGRHGRHRAPSGHVTWWSGDLNPDLPTQVISVERPHSSVPLEYAEPTPELCHAVLDGLRRLT